MLAEKGPNADVIIMNWMLTSSLNLFYAQII